MEDQKMIVAKPVIPNQYWILRDGDHKVGNIEADPGGGFQVKINNHVERFKTITTIKRKVAIDFEPVVSTPKISSTNQVNGFPTTHHPYNAIYDVQHRVPLWTREPRSRSWYAAGWFRIQQGRKWSVVKCPKLITLQRYPYTGPYYSAEEAERT